jgi:hypothetical protein
MASDGDSPKATVDSTTHDYKTVRHFHVVMSGVSFTSVHRLRQFELRWELYPNLGSLWHHDVIDVIITAATFGGRAEDIISFYQNICACDSLSCHIHWPWSYGGAEQINIIDKLLSDPVFPRSDIHITGSRIIRVHDTNYCYIKFI